MSREDWGCDNTRLQYLQEGIASWLKTRNVDSFHYSIDRIEVYPLCSDNPNTFSRMYNIDGKNVIHLYMYNILRAAEKYQVYVKLLTMFLIEHEVQHLIYNSRRGSLDEEAVYELLSWDPSEEKFCDDNAFEYMRTMYSPSPLEGLNSMFYKRRDAYIKEADETRKVLRTMRSPRVAERISPF